MKKPKQTKEEVIIALLKKQQDQFSLFIDILSDLPAVDKGEVKIFRLWLKQNMKLIKKLG